MASFMVADYLDGNESAELSRMLQAEGMAPFVKRHGLPRFFGVEANYRVFVDHSCRGNARKVFQQFKEVCDKKRSETIALLTTQCPLCKSTKVATRGKTSLLQKIRFIGVTVWECKECHGRWYT